MTRPLLYGLPCGLASMMEKQPQIRFSMQAFLNAVTSGPSRRHMIAGFVSIDRPCKAYSGNTTRSMPGILRRAFATIAQMRSVCSARSCGVRTTGSCSCTMPSTTPFGDLFNPPSPLIRDSPGRVIDRSAVDARLAGRARQRAARGAGGDHDAERQNVRRRVEEVIARADAPGWSGRAEGAGAAEEQRGEEAVDRIPAREDHQRHRHQPLAARE